MESLFEELGEEQKGGPLVEAVAFVVYETAAAAGEAVLLEDRDVETGFCESCCGCDAAYSCACLCSLGDVGEGEFEDGVWSLPTTMAVFFFSADAIVVEKETCAVRDWQYSFCFHMLIDSCGAFSASTVESEVRSTKS